MRRLSRDRGHARPALRAAVATTLLATATMTDGVAGSAVAANAELCAARAAIAAEAAGLRKEGVDETDAVQRLTAAHADDNPQVLGSLGGVVRWTYMAKMPPDAAAAYFREQCLKT